MEGLADESFLISNSSSLETKRGDHPHRPPATVAKTALGSRAEISTNHGSWKAVPYVADAPATPPGLGALVRQGILRNLREHRAQPGYGAGFAENRDHLVD